MGSGLVARGLWARGSCLWKRMRRTGSGNSRTRAVTMGEGGVWCAAGLQDAPDGIAELEARGRANKRGARGAREEGDLVCVACASRRAYGRRWTGKQKVQRQQRTTVMAFTAPFGSSRACMKLGAQSSYQGQHGPRSHAPAMGGFAALCTQRAERACGAAAPARRRGGVYRPVRPYVVYPMHPSMAMLRAAVGRKTGVALAGRGLAHWHCAVLAPAWPHSAPGDAPSNSLQARIPAYLPSAHLAPLSAPSPPRAWLGLSAIAAHAHPGTLAFAHSPWPLAM
ncbi:hypothetical protein J3E71DRAFT_243262 [Bipolaris maydis]|nr:hypothetical protein J3E71DRAFT_243262 [Bipolaris maydis]